MREENIEQVNKHHINSPSCLERRWLCPGSARIEAGLSEEESIYAAEGTRLHEIVATRNLEACETFEEEDICQRCIELVDRLSEGAERVEVEYPLEVCDSNSNIITYGTADVVIIQEDSLIIIDWKFGRGEVTSAEYNIQLGAYALGAMQEFGKSSCTVHIVQPFVGKWNDCYTHMDKEYLQEFYETLIDCTNVPDAPLVAGEKQCKYCKGASQLTCPAMRYEVIKTADMAEQVELDISELTNEQLSDLHKKCKFVANINKAVESRIKEICTTQGRCHDIELKTMQGNREIKDIGKILDATKGNVSVDELLECCTVSVSKLESTFARNYKSVEGGTLKDAKLKFADNLKDVISRKDDKVSLVTSEICNE